MIGDAEQYQELTTLYGSYGDNELAQLGRGMTDLTEMAQEILRSELKRRGLTIAPAAEPVEARVFTDEETSNMRSYAAMAPAECIFEFEDDRGASAAYYALTVADIQAIVLSAQNSNGGTLGPRVVVTPKDAERAAAILSQSLEGELQPVAEESEEFALPHCPACGGEETLLESADPVNQWRCDDCGKVWLEDAAASIE
jgi:hypothetical protein